MAKENKHYLTGKEIKAIAKANAKEMKRLEAFKNRLLETDFMGRCPKDVLNILGIKSKEKTS